MALIRCPECGKQISDKAAICVGCGFPIHDYIFENQKQSEESKSDDNDSASNVNNGLEECPYCGEKVSSEDEYCEACGMRLVPYRRKKKPTPTDDNLSHSNEIDDENDEEKKASFTGIYKRGFGGRLIEVYCPRCGSSNCSHTQVPQTIPGKTKAFYSVNLNPLRPFTFANRKEKIIRKDQTIIVDKIVCNSCGHIFS